MASALRLSSYARPGTRNQLVILIARERDKERAKKKERERIVPSALFLGEIKSIDEHIYDFGCILKLTLLLIKFQNNFLFLNEDH